MIKSLAAAAKRRDGLVANKKVNGQISIKWADLKAQDYRIISSVFFWNGCLFCFHKILQLGRYKSSYKSNIAESNIAEILHFIYVCSLSSLKLHPPLCLRYLATTQISLHLSLRVQLLPGLLDLVTTDKELNDLRQKKTFTDHF
jgi:hypothetical protein